MSYTRSDLTVMQSEAEVTQASGFSEGQVLRVLDEGQHQDYRISITNQTNALVMSDGKFAVPTVSSSLSGGNLLSNHNFLIASPDGITHPSSTPETYAAGTQIFSGAYAGPSGATITLINGRVNCTAGSYQFKLANTGGLERVPVFTSSVSDYDGIPKEVGVSHALVGNEYVVTVTPAAGDVFSVKFEQGSVATGHEVGTFVDGSGRATFPSYDYASSVSSYAGVSIVETLGHTIFGLGQNAYARDLNQTAPSESTPFRFQAADGSVWKSLVVEQTPEHFGATLIDGEDQTPYMQALEDWGKEYDRPTYYNPVIYEMQTKLEVTRAPQMHGKGGGNGSLRARNSDFFVTGTVFYSKVTGDYCLQAEPPAYEFGGRIDDITVLGHLTHESPKVIGHGVRIAQWGWSAQVNRLTIEGFQGKNLSIGYLQDTAFNSLTLLDGSNGSDEPMLEFSGTANFLYFNNPHFEEAGYFIKVRDGSIAPWEVQFNCAHFETGNYYNGAAASSPDPSLERRYTSPPIFSNENLRMWKFNDCFFVPCGVVALNADNTTGIDNQPYFIQFNDCNGVEFNNCKVQAPTSAVDTIRLETADLTSSFGRNRISGLEVVNANPTKYALKTNNTTIRDVDYNMEDSLSVSRLYGIEADNGFVDNVRYSCKEVAATRTEGYLLHSQILGKTKLGYLDYELASPAFKYVDKNTSIQNDGYEEFELPTGGAIDLEKYPSDAQFIKTATGDVTVTDIANANVGRKLYITNASPSLLTILPTANILPGDAIGQNQTVVYFSTKDNVLRPM